MRRSTMLALVVSAATLAMTGQALAQTPVLYDGYKPVKNALGQPDLTGVWDYATITPFERAAAHGARLELSREEMAAAEGKVAAISALSDAPTAADATVKDIPADCSAGRGSNCNYNSAWTDPGSKIMLVGGKPRTSILITPDGRVPSNLKGQRMSRAVDNSEEGGAGSGTAQPGAARADRDGRNDNPEGRSYSERCIAMGQAVPRSGLYNNNYLIQQSRDSVAIVTEMIHELRIVRIGEKHRTDGQRPWGGDSIGWYDGNTLVVETTGYHPQQNYYGASDQLKITERFTRVSPTRLHYAFSVEDAKTWAKPWGGEFEFAASPGIFEYACHEGNYGLENILAGARAEEREASVGGARQTAGR